jgi:drug/metabolite transporter (DMT)-like permease
MFKLILLGLVSGAFFSSTFILNEIMSVSGGHWLWSASLRYLFMILFLMVIVFYQGGIKLINEIFKLFKHHLSFWLFSGSMGFGMFYALICYSADYAPGWVIAATWQFTVVASLFVFMLFGKRFPIKIWLFSLIIFIGVSLVNFSHINDFDLHLLIAGGLPVLLAAFCYPLGNQLLWEAKNGKHDKIPKITSPLLNNPFAKVLLLSLGSIPLWLILVAFIQPTLPSSSQIIDTSLVALLSGICATSIFLYARNKAKNASELAGVDATQASEVVFTLIAGMLFINTELPSNSSFWGLLLIMFGLFMFVKHSNKVS